MRKKDQEEEATTDKISCHDSDALMAETDPCHDEKRL
jgi:hypothetical protein